MKTFVKVRVEFEGVHRYPKAPKEVAHLRNDHRHTFIVTAQVQVRDSDREIEFYMLRDYLKSTLQDGHLDYLSCEMINEQVMEKLQWQYGVNREYIVETSEDGIRSAVTYSH